MKKKKWIRRISMFLAAALIVTSADVGGGSLIEALAAQGDVEVLTIENANFDFEAGTDGWTTEGTVSVETSGAKEGNNYVHLEPGASISTIVQVDQGSYTLSAWVKGTQNNKNNAKLIVSDTGAPNAESLLNTYLSKEWGQMANRNVLVYNGQMKITITAGNCSVDVDALELACDSKDQNTISNWDFEAGLDGWKTTGTAVVDSDNTDTGSKAVKLADQSEISQTISVKPNTRYSVTMRAKVDRQDEFKTVYHTNYLGKTGETQDRTVLGDRVNLGVRGAGNVVYRQAPAGTTDYALVSITFTTGSGVNQVEVYANTKYDQAYKDSVTVYSTSESEEENGGTIATKESLADNWKSNGKDFAYVDNFDIFEIDDANYLRGADISFLPAIENFGGKYFANGVQQDCLRILSNHGVNSVLTMIMVHAGKVTHSTSTGKALDQLEGQKWDLRKEDGSIYEYKMIEGGYFDKEHCREIGKRATELGMSYIPSFHFSDTWISNAKAYTPEEWLNVDYEGNYTNSDIEHIQSAVYNYVYDFMKNLKQDDVNVGAVKIGNEQNGGMIWPVGQGASSVGHAKIIASAYNAIQDAFPGISGWVHSNNGYTPGNIDTFFGGLLRNGAKMDGVTFSLYGGRSSYNTVINARQIAALDALKYMDFVNVETGFTFTSYVPTAHTANSSMYTPAYYQKSPNGQYNWLMDYMQAALDVENPHGQTRGFYYWETDWIPTPGAGSSAGASSDINQRTMFNNGDVNIHEMGSSQDGRAGDMMDSMYAYLMRGCAKKTTTDMQTPLTEGKSHTYAVEVAEPTGITLEDTDISLKVGENVRLKPTIAPVDKVLTDWSIDYTSSNPGVAYINGNGFVCAKSAGTATITAKVGKVSTTATVTVSDAQTATGISVKANGNNAADMSVKLFEQIQLAATLEGNPTDTTVVYTSSNPEVAKFFGETWQTPKGEMRQETDKGTKVQLNAVGQGTTTIMVATADGTQSASFQVTVTKTDVEAVTISGEKEISLSYGRTKQLSASVTPSNTSRYKILWKSSDPEIATVDETGLVKAVGIGDVTITAYSDDNPEIKDTCLVHALNTQVESISLDRASLVLQKDSTKKITALIAPDDAYDKSVAWTSENEEIATVDSDGNVTGNALGETTIIATTTNGGLTATCKVIVQAEAVPVSGVSMSEEEYFFQSDYFSEVNQTEEKPVHRLSVNVTPETATDDSVIWKSDTPEVAAVDDYGRVTAVAPGVAQITATTKDGGFVCSSKVYVPSVSESFDNRETEAWTLAGNPLWTSGVQTASLADDNSNRVMVLSGSGNGGRGFLKKFSKITKSEKLVVDFNWQPGNFANSTGSYIAIADSQNHRYVTLQQNAKNTELVYAPGSENYDVLTSTTSSVIGSGFNKSDAWYKVHVVIDYQNRTTCFTITNLENPSITATHEWNFADGVAFTGDVGGLLGYAERTKGVTMSVSMSLDNLNIYPAAPTVQQLKTDKSSIKLIPVKDTLMASSQIKTTILPASASQECTYTSSDPSVVTVDENGLVLPVTTYDNLEDVVEKNCTITVASKIMPEKKVEIPVTITKSLNASEFFSVKDEQGIEVWPQNTVEMETATQKQLFAVLTGGDGATDIAKIKWESENPQIVAVDEQSGIISAKKAGTTNVVLTVTLYTKEEKTAVIPITVAGMSYVDTAELETAIANAIAAKEYADDYYDTKSLNKYQKALKNAEDACEAAKAEKWLDDRQDEIDTLAAALNTSVNGLKKAEFIALTDIEITGLTNPLSIGKQGTVSAAGFPDYATEKVVFTSDNPSVAVVDKLNGNVYGRSKGTATITAMSESGAIQKTTTVMVTDDLTSYYEENGIGISGTATKRPTTNAFVNARNMNMKVGDNGWTPGGGVKNGEIVLDFGSQIQIDNVATSFWTPLLYTMDISDDGENWTTVIDHSAEAVGAIDKTDTAPYVDEFPEDTRARYFRVHDIKKTDGGDWLGITILQVNGAYVSNQVFAEEQSNELEGTIATGDTIEEAKEKLPALVGMRLANTVTENVSVQWSDTDIYHAITSGAGDYVIHGTVLTNGIHYDVIGNVNVEQSIVVKKQVTFDDGGINPVNAGLKIEYSDDEEGAKYPITKPVILVDGAALEPQPVVTYTFYKNAGTEEEPSWELLEKKPTEEGVYKVVIAIPEEDDEYTGEASYEFSIYKVHKETTGGESGDHPGSGTTGGSGASTPSTPSQPADTKPSTDDKSDSTTDTKPSTDDKSNSTIETKPDGSKVETKKETETNTSGKQVDVSTVTTTDAAGTVTSIVEKSTIQEIADNTTATVTVKKDGDGTITSAKASVTSTIEGKKATISADVVAQLKEAAGQNEVTVSLTVKNEEGKTLYTVKADAEELTAESELRMFKQDKKTGELVMVNTKTYKVDKEGNLDISIKNKAAYELVSKEEAKAIEKQIKATIKVQKASKNVKKGKTTQVAFDKKLNMENVKDITYASADKKIAKVSKSGKVTAKAKGSVKIKAEVTLKNGEKKTVTMKINVK